MILAARQLAVFINGELKNLEHIVKLAEERITTSKQYPDERANYPSYVPRAILSK